MTTQSQPRQRSKSGPNSIPVLVVEDDALEARRIVETLDASADIRCVAAVSSLEEALAAARKYEPKVVLFDLHLNGSHCPEGISDLKVLLPSATILVLTHYEESSLIFESLRHGADGYILKSDVTCPLPVVLRQAMEEGAPLSRPVARRILGYFRKQGASSGVPRLSPRQRQVVELICEGRFNKEIADQLGISADAVKQHIAAVKLKLRARSRSQIATWFESFRRG